MKKLLLTLSVASIVAAPPKFQPSGRVVRPQLKATIAKDHACFTQHIKGAVFSYLGVEHVAHLREQQLQELNTVVEQLGCQLKQTNLSDSMDTQ